MTYCITLGDGTRVSALRYIAGIRRGKEHPEATFTRSLRDRWPATGAEIMAQYRHDLAKRITQRGGATQTEARVKPSTWATVAAHRVRIEPDRGATLNRHQRRHVAHRIARFEE